MESPFFEQVIHILAMNILIHTTLRFWAHRSTLFLHGGVVVASGLIWRVAHDAEITPSLASRQGWIWLALLWGLLWDMGSGKNPSLSSALEQYILHRRSLLGWLIGTWMGYMIFFLYPLAWLLHALSHVPFYPIMVFLGTGLISALALMFWGLTTQAQRGAALVMVIPMMIPVVILCTHPLSGTCALPDILNMNGWILLGLWLSLMPLQFWITQKLLIKSLSFPVFLLDSSL